MDCLFLCLLMTLGGNFGDEQQSSTSGKEKKSQNRHSAHQTKTLEEFFKDCPHPNETQRRQLSRDLGLDIKQIKFWFQNKRTQTKANADRYDNSALRAANLKIRLENDAMGDILKSVLCPACGGPPEGVEERQHYLQNLRLENAQLSEEKAKVSSYLAQHVDRTISFPFAPFPVDLTAAAAQGLGNQMEGLNLNPETSENAASGYQIIKVTDTDKVCMSETAARAVAELSRLVRVDEPLWVKSSNGGRYIIHNDIYENIFPKTTLPTISNVRIESSKDSGLVGISPTSLVDMFLDSDKWADLFPTIVTQAKTLEILNAGMIGNRSGALLLMYEQMHVLSPLVAPREFYFLRHCIMIEDGVWIIVDVSYNFLKESFYSFWKLPSGVMIEEMPYMCSKVTWVEHIEVDSRRQIHRLYKDLICGNSPYGSDCWLSSLQRMSERLAFSLGEIPPPDFGEGFTVPEGKSGIMKLSGRMIKRFCSILSMPNEMSFRQVSAPNYSGIQFSVRKSSQPGEPCGTIVTAASSLWLPLSPESVFSYFLDIQKRHQWDVLSGGSPVSQIARLTTGNNPGNCISIITPGASSEAYMGILQETLTDTLGSLLIFAPVNLPTMNASVSDNEAAGLEILPSGIIICRDGCQATGGGAASSSSSVAVAGGSILTVVLQTLACDLSKEMNTEFVAKINTLIISTVERIKVALGCDFID